MIGGRSMKSMKPINMSKKEVGRFSYLTARNIIDKPTLISRMRNIEFCNGNGYYKDGSGSIILHRKNLPAHIANGRIWYKNGRKHNINGPAIIFKSGHLNYYLNGIEYTNEEWEVKRLKYLQKETK